jgi:hypothetical protein
MLVLLTSVPASITHKTSSFLEMLPLKLALKGADTSGNIAKYSPDAL